jgi:GT2 family glycosyltransferase
MKIYAVVVTYNRLELLQKNIDCLRRNRPVTQIVVVNNGSTDGTAQWLDEQSDLKVLHQSNVGGSGGFYTGMQYAYELGAEWIWCMDDDVFPRENCLEEMLRVTDRPTVGIVAPRRLMEGKIFTHDFQQYNLEHPFKSMYQKRLAKMEVHEPTPIVGTAFEGPLIRREVVQQIGLPNRDLFIFCDDTEYCLRTTLAGWEILYVPQALMDKHKFFSTDSWSERNRKKKWKRFYQVRNSAYLNHHYGRNWGVRYLRGFNNMAGYYLTALVTMPFSKVYQRKDLKNLWRAYCDGVHERLGKL